MSMKPWQKIDKFFPVYIVVLVLLAGLVILTFRGIFSSLTLGYAAEEGGNRALIIDRGKLDDALKEAFERENIPLEVTDERIPLEETE